MFEVHANMNARTHRLNAVQVHIKNTNVAGLISILLPHQPSNKLYHAILAHIFHLYKTRQAGLLHYVR
jgi:hypothetical protein